MAACWPQAWRQACSSAAGKSARNSDNRRFSPADKDDDYGRDGGDKPVGVLRVLRALDEWLLRFPDDLHRLVYEYLQDAATHQVRYAEFFWNPTGTAHQSGIAYPVAATNGHTAVIAGQRLATREIVIFTEHP